MSINFNDLEKYQIENKNKIIKYDDFNFSEIQYVAGLDISFDKNNDANACAYITIVDLSLQKIIYEDYLMCQNEILPQNYGMNMPYKSGFLGFREIPYYKILLEKIKDEPFFPQILMVDGFGILHYHEFGSASHLGYELNIPTIGVGKKILCHDGLDKQVINNLFLNKCKSKGDYIELIGLTGKIYGAALKSSDDTTTPIFVSIGHRISLETAIKIVIDCCLHKIPEPIRNSDIKSRQLL